VFLMQPPSGALGFVPHPGMPPHGPTEPHRTQAAWLHVGGASAAAIVKTVLMPRGNGKAMPSAVIHGVGRQPPWVPPQSASLLHGPNRFAADDVWQIDGPLIPSNWYVPGIG